MLLKIKDIKKYFDKYLCLILERPQDLPAGRQGFHFYAGQYLDIKLPVKDPSGDTRAFTISSSPTEDFLMVTPKKGISPFKKFVEKLQVGDKIESSHPAGTFILDETENAVFIAGGVGITPFRSIIKYVADNELQTSITLIYSNSDNNFLFKEELEGWKSNLPNLTIIYYNSSQNGRLNSLNTKYLIPNTIYYLAGSHSFVNAVALMLIESGIEEINIRYDRFDGYL